MGSALTGQLGLAGSQLGLLQLGGPAYAQQVTRRRPQTAKPLIAHVYAADGITFQQTLSPLLKRPVLHWKSNGSYDAITLELQAQGGGGLYGSSLYGIGTYGSLALGQIVRLTEQDGDGSILYTGVLEAKPDVVDIAQPVHQIELSPISMELDDTMVQLVYSKPTDPAQMFRDAVGTTTHLTCDQVSVPASTGVLYPQAGGAALDFTNRFAREVCDVVRSMLGPTWFWFVDPEGRCWLQSMGSAATYTLKRGVDYRKRIWGGLGGSIKGLKNDILVVGGVPQGGSAPVQARYRSHSFGVDRGLQQPISLPSITDQAALTAVASTVGVLLDRPLVRVQLEVLGTFGATPGAPLSLGTRVNMAQPGGAMVRFYEPLTGPQAESGSGTGNYIGPFIVQDCQDDGAVQTVVAGDVPLTDSRDVQYLGDAALNRALANVLLYTPGALNVQGVVTGSGGLATAPNPPAGQPSPQRWTLDRASFRAYDGTANNYGAPSGPGVSVEITSDGRLFLGGAAANLVIDDVNGVPRVELGPMPARGISPAQNGLRLNTALGVPIIDTFGLCTPGSLLGSALNVSQAGVTGNGAWQAVSGSTVSFSLVRPALVLVLGAATVVDPTVADSGFNLEGTILIDGAQSNSNGPVFAPGTASFPMTPFAILPSLAAGSHTAALGVNQTNTHLWTVIGGYVYVLLFGA